MCNTAFSRQQWFPEGAPMLRLHYIARLVFITIVVLLLIRKFIIIIIIIIIAIAIFIITVSVLPGY